MLHRNVAIIDGVAVLGINGWGYINDDYNIPSIYRLHAREDDVLYLDRGVEKIQLHLDVKKLVLVSSIVPDADLYFGEKISNRWDYDLTNCVINDTEKKITHWAFGGSSNIVDINKCNINYISNPYYTNKENYWPKRISIVV